MKLNHRFIFGSLIVAASVLVTTSVQAGPYGGGGGFGGGGRLGGGGGRMGGGGRFDAPNATTDRSGSYDSLHHGSGTFNSSVTRSPGDTSGATTWTNQNGGQGSHSFNNTYTSTGNGTATSTHAASTTYANGKTSSSSGSWVKTAPGDSTYTGTHDGANGDITDVDRTATTTDGVRNVDSTYDNTTTGKVTQVDKTVSTNPNGSKQVDTTATLPDDKTVSSAQTYTKDSNGYIKTGTVTGPNGGVSSDNKDVSFTKDANGEVTRTATGSVTGPNGNTTLTGNTETWAKTVTPNPTTTSTLPPQN